MTDTMKYRVEYKDQNNTKHEDVIEFGDGHDQVNSYRTVLMRLTRRGMTNIRAVLVK